MFSSNPFPEPPSSPNVFFPPSFVVDHEKDCVSFNYHLNNSDPFFSGDCFFYTHNSTLAPPSPVNENITTINQQFSEAPSLQSSEDHDELIDLVISCSKKKTGESKKDGHSKIYTAHGPRDRRVRLSIDISRKFFCLQDLLGFDRASKTLDWLFVKCKTAIKELVEDTNRCSSSTATDDQSKMNFLESVLDEKKGQKKKSISKYADGKSKKITQKHRGGFQENLSREQSRAVARALARERAREKMRIKKLDDELKTSVLNHFDYQNLETVTEEYHRLISASSLESISGGAGVIL